MQFKYLAPVAAIVCVAAAPTQAADDLVSLNKEMIATLGELNTKLDSIKDTASADAAVADLEKITAKLKDLQNKMVALGNPAPTEEQVKELQPLQVKMMETLGKLIANQQRIEAAEIKSEKFEKLMNQGADESTPAPAEGDKAAPAPTSIPATAVQPASASVPAAVVQPAQTPAPAVAK